MMEETQNRFFKLVMVLGVLLVLAGTALWIGRPMYRNWKQEKFLAQAEEFMAKSDFKQASLCARKVLALNPRNPAACRVMARIADTVKSPEVINWLQRMVELEPGSLTNRIDLARAALAQGDVLRAQKALNGVDEAGRKNVAFHSMAALVAASANQIALSEAHYAEAARLDPENKRLQLNLAVLHLQARNPEVAEEGRRSLEKLAADDNYKLDARRILIAAGLRTNDFAAALRNSTELVADPKSRFDDRLLNLTVLASAKNPGLEPYLATLQKEAEKRPEQVYALSSWLIQRDRAADAIRWVSGLAVDLKKQWPVPMALVDAHTVRKDWASLDTLLNERKWEEMEFARLALLARVAFEQKQSLSQKAQWLGAVREAGDRLRAVTSLLQMAHAWRWDSEEEDLLWHISQRFPKEGWVLKELERFYHRTRNTRGLNKVYAAMLDYDDKNLYAKNNFAAISLLLKLNLDKAHAMARESFDQRPKDPVTVSTYAYSLHLQGKTAQAIKTMETLTAKELEKPGIAAYYGLMLAANGEGSKARKYLDIASGSPLLSEEKAFVQEALKGI